MPAFLTNLRQSWVVNRLRVGGWYYRRRFPLLGGGKTDCRVTIKAPFSNTSCQLRFLEKEDAYQALNLFRDANPWNKLQPEREPKTIVDLGANRGFSTLYWRNRFPDAEIHGVEMNAGNCDCCRRLFAENHLSGKFHNVAVGDQNGQVRYRAHASHTRHRLEKLIKDDDAYNYDNTTVEIPCLSLDSFLHTAGIGWLDLLKVDIEGAEQFLLETIETWKATVQFMLLEIHHNIDPVWAHEKLARAGFQVDVGDAQSRTEWWCRRPRLTAD